MPGGDQYLILYRQSCIIAKLDIVWPMIATLIKDIFPAEAMKQLIDIPIVAYYLFRSFDAFTQNIIFRMMMSPNCQMDRD
jgi:hypothetical protein